MWWPTQIEIEFWGALILGLTANFFMPDSWQGYRKAAFGIICGAAAGIYGIDPLMSVLPVDPSWENGFVVVLALTGDKIALTLSEHLPSIIINKLKWRAK